MQKNDKVIRIANVVLCLDVTFQYPTGATIIFGNLATKFNETTHRFMCPFTYAT